MNQKNNLLEDKVLESTLMSISFRSVNWIKGNFRGDPVIPPFYYKGKYINEFFIIKKDGSMRYHNREVGCLKHYDHLSLEDIWYYCPIFNLPIPEDVIDFLKNEKNE